MTAIASFEDHQVVALARWLRLLSRNRKRANRKKPPRQVNPPQTLLPLQLMPRQPMLRQRVRQRRLPPTLHRRIV